MIGYVYEIVCRVKGKPIYVGSSVEPAVRFYQHLSKVSKGTTAIYKYLRAVGSTPTMNIIETVEYEYRRDLLNAERRWIIKYAKLGYPILNEKRQVERIGNERAVLINLPLATIFGLETLAKNDGMECKPYMEKILIEFEKQKSK